MGLADYLNGVQSYDDYIAEAMAEVGTRVLVAVERDGHWTVIDRETKELIGSFGMEVNLPTRDEALDEAQRFGSKWDWPVDRDWRGQDWLGDEIDRLTGF